MIIEEDQENKLIRHVRFDTESEMILFDIFTGLINGTSKMKMDNLIREYKSNVETCDKEILLNNNIIIKCGLPKDHLGEMHCPIQLFRN